MTVRELANDLASTEREPSIADATPTGRRTIENTLAHVHLPTLAEAGLVSLDRPEATVEATEHPALEDPRFRRLLELDVKNLDATLERMSHDRRRLALAVLRDEGTKTPRAALARAILRRETGEIDPHPEAIDDLIVLLHHVHLPKLADADLVVSDPETGATTYTGHPAAEAVFTTVVEPGECLVDKLDGFLSGLGMATEETSRDASERLDWPHFWRTQHPG